MNMKKMIDEIYTRNPQNYMGQELNVSVVTNFCQEPFFSKFLNIDFQKRNIKTKICYYNELDYAYPEKQKEILNSHLIILFINYEIKYEKGDKSFTKTTDEVINDTVALISLFERNSKSKLFVISYEDFSSIIYKVVGSQIRNEGIDYINQQIKKSVESDIVMIDLKRIIAANGIKASYDVKNFCRWDNPYSKEVYAILSKEIVQHFEKFMTKKIKCIVLDCDNVLWYGNVSDIGEQGIEVGETNRGYIYQRFQKYMFELFKRGMILTICSKNEERDVLSVFENNDNMILKMEYFSAYRINWISKADNIKDISKEIGIAFENMLFIDDSEYEIESVKQSIPGINVLLYRANSIFEDADIVYLDIHEDLKGSIIRTETYRNNKHRDDLRKKSFTLDEYLQSIENDIIIKKSCEKELSRISELSLRANRMSSHKRYDLYAIKELFYQKEYQLYSVYCSDKFGDLGLVGCIGIDNLHRWVDLFCLSCRALGRGVENRMLEYIQSNHVVEGYFFELDNRNAELNRLFQISFGEGVSGEKREYVRDDKRAKNTELTNGENTI